MILPDNCENLIKLQRSKYGKSDIKKSFQDDLENEFNSIINFLPEDCKKIIDIGCGLAGISIQLHHYYDSPFLYLVDKNEITQNLKYGFSENPSFYNSFEILEKIMKLNNIGNYEFVSPDNDFSKMKNIDIVISLLACGFHFPLYHYFGRIYESLSKNGILIVDIRKQQYNNEIKLIELYFRNYEEIQTDNPKTVRICAKEKICLA
jgi:hypothetical protein